MTPHIREGTRAALAELSASTFRGWGHLHGRLFNVCRWLRRRPFGAGAEGLGSVIPSCGGAVVSPCFQEVVIHDIALQRLAEGHLARNSRAA